MEGGWLLVGIRSSLWVGMIMAAVVGPLGCRRPTGQGIASGQAAPQQTIVNFTIRETQQGKLLWTLQAKEAQIFEAQEIADLVAPYWEYFQATDAGGGVAGATNRSAEPGRGWRAREMGARSGASTPRVGVGGGLKVQKTRLWGKQGKVHLKQHDLDVKGQVVVDSDNGSRLETEELRYLAGPQRIVSDVAVKLTRPDSITTGIGLEATPDLKLVTIQKERVEVKR